MRKTKQINMTTEELIKRLEGLQKLEPDTMYGMPIMEEAEDGEYTSLCEIEELINELKQTI